MKETAAGSRLQGLNETALRSVAAAGAALEAGRADEAERQLVGAMALRPDHAEVLRLRAGIHSQRGEHAEAVRCMRQAIAQRPQDALYYNTLGSILDTANEMDAAIDALQNAVALKPDLAIAWFNLGVLLTRSVRHDEAVAALKRAIALDAHHAAARAMLADLLRMEGRSDEAATEYRTILASRPSAGMAWWGLADLKNSKFSADDLERMRRALDDPRAGDDDLIATGFALAKALDDQERYGDSLAELARANEIARRRRRWNAPAFTAMASAMESAFLPAPAASPRALGAEVVFIVGLPRSGSTLVEQILASHSSVEGAGELADLPLVIAEESRRLGRPFPSWVSGATPEDWQRLGERYLERTARWRERRPMFTDKLPNNWLYLGAIAAMLPAARIVTCSRDPLETCFSCYRQFMRNNEYTRTFSDLAAYWRDYARIAANARATRPAHVHESVYESLLADPERYVRDLLAFCGLAFEASCLEFHRTARAVRSPSANQVRQPLRRDTARAPSYGALLDPLRVELGMPPYRI